MARASLKSSDDMPVAVVARRESEDVDYQALAGTLEALAYPLRLELLRVLQFPHTLREIRIAPLRSSGVSSPAQAAARQTIERHLRKLQQVGLVRSVSETQEGRLLNKYAVDSQRLYAFTEDIRSLSTIYAGKGLASDQTSTTPARREDHPRRDPRPQLVVVHGLREGKSFPLATDREASRWRIGRSRRCEVVLDYDPFISTEHAAVAREAGRFLLEDLGSKNGTFLNWDAVGPGQKVPVVAGDVVGVGRSLLCFRGG